MEIKINFYIKTINIMQQIKFYIKDDLVVHKCEPTFINEVFSNQSCIKTPKCKQ